MAKNDRPLPERLRQHAREQPPSAAYIWKGGGTEVVVTWAELDHTGDAFAARLQALPATGAGKVLRRLLAEPS